MIIGAGLFQVLVLGYMAGQREHVVRTGRTVYLRTAPVDPRDIFRGDYVRLSYDASTIPMRMFRGDKADIKDEKGKRLYAALDIGDSGLADVLYVTDRKPENDPFVRARLDYAWDRAMRLKYGIEAYFIQQGKGQQLEQTRSRGGIQIPMEMEMALGRNGIAVLTGHRWSSLGIGITLEPETDQPPKAITIKILNASDKPVAIVDPPDARSILLEPDINQWREEDWRWAHEVDSYDGDVLDSDVHILQPDEVYSIKIDLSQPRWFVTKDGEDPRTITGLERWWPRFRFVYSPPSQEDSSHLEHANLIWHGQLKTQTFSGSGQVD